MTARCAFACASGPAWAASACALSISALYWACTTEVSRANSACLRTDACCASAAAWSAAPARSWPGAGWRRCSARPSRRCSRRPCRRSTGSAASPRSARSWPSRALDPSSTSVASFCRSVTISSTVIEPMIERRWPAKIRPVSTDIWSWSDRNRCPALTMDSSSLPTLNAITDAHVQRDALLGHALLGDLGLLHGQGEVADLAEYGRDEGAVADHHPERRAFRAAPSSGNQHGLVRGRNTVAEHRRSSPKERKPRSAGLRRACLPTR